ncbi:hypothetical protein SNE40_000723 [Patella caerulea]|uniref:Chitin-binding type-2 domain-containing protein n=1 Tax=Patella caerulea TaxID=87958 RepID=A0AAN8Q7D2_PATCE
MVSWLISLLPVLLIHHLTEAALYPGILDLDWLCMEEGVYARNIPWDCKAYAVCSRGRAYSFRCPHSMNYNAILSTCEFDNNYGTNDCLQNPFNYLDILCLYNPQAKIASAASCAQYFDCAQASSTPEYSKYVMECPYPDLFSTKTGKCASFRNVKCETRKDAKAPCDYVQYQQMCSDSKNCKQCSRRHPSCVSKPNGFHQVPSSYSYFMFCLKERTLLIKKCPQNKVFSKTRVGCV